MKAALLVMVGGAAGALTRYLIYLLFQHLRGPSVVATFAINISGSFALGFLLAIVLGRIPVSPGLQLLLGFGFLSSYTTFSTLMWDAFHLAQGGSVTLAALNLSLSVVVGMASVTSGFLVGRSV